MSDKNGDPFDPIIEEAFGPPLPPPPTHQTEAIVGPEGGLLPRSWREAVPYVAWCFIVLGFALEFVNALTHYEWSRAAVCFAGLFGMMAALIYWSRLRVWASKTNPSYAFAGASLLLAAIILSPFIEQQRWPFSDRAPEARDPGGVAEAVVLKERLASTEKQLDAMTETVRSLLKTAPAPPPPPSDIKSSSNRQLKENATAFADELRKFEARFQLEDRMAQQKDWAAMAAVPQNNTEEKTKKWTAMITAQTQRDQQHRAEYQTRFRKNVLLYKTRICEIREFTSPCPNDHTAKMLIDENFLVGVYPIMSVADYLTLIARENDDEAK